MWLRRFAGRKRSPAGLHDFGSSQGQSSLPISTAQRLVRSKDDKLSTSLPECRRSTAGGWANSVPNSSPRSGNVVMKVNRSGKTSFVQGLGKGLGIPTLIHSPTFILANEHRSGRLPLFHVDVYRVRGSDEAMGFGLDDYLSDEGVCVIEWAEKIRPALPSEHLWLAFRHLGESKRGLLIQANGSRYEELLNEFKESVFAFKSARDMDASDPNTVDPHNRLTGARHAAGD